MQTTKISLISKTLLLICMSVLCSSYAFAQIGTTSTSSEILPVVIEDPQPRPRTVVSSLSRQQQMRITNLAANVSNRFEATVARLEAIMRRITSRIQKMEIDGFDMEATKIKFVEARTNLNLAKEGLRNIDAKVANATSSEKPQEAWIAVRDAFVTTRAHLVATKQSLKDVVTEMKQAQLVQQTANDTASTTEEISE